MATPIENNTEGLQEILQMVNELPTQADVKLQEKSVTPSTSSQSVTPDNGYAGLSKVTVGAMPTATQATPSISVSTSGVITASATQTAGYVTAGTKTATQNLTTQGAQTITPGTSDKTIASGRYLTGTQTIKGDSNLVAGNIKSGVSIFDVSGSFSGVTVQRKTGSFTTNSDGNASVDNLGFKPDLIVFTSETWWDEPSYSSFSFLEIANDSIVLAVAPPDESTYLMSFAAVTATTSGFSVSMTKNNYSYQGFADSDRRISYIAIKYS